MRNDTRSRRLCLALVGAALVGPAAAAPSWEEVWQLNRDGHGDPQTGRLVYEVQKSEYLDRDRAARRLDSRLTVLQLELRRMESETPDDAKAIAGKQAEVEAARVAWESVPDGPMEVSETSIVTQLFDHLERVSREEIVTVNSPESRQPPVLQKVFLRKAEQVTQFEPRIMEAYLTKGSGDHSLPQGRDWLRWGLIPWSDSESGRYLRTETTAGLESLVYELTSSENEGFRALVWLAPARSYQAARIEVWRGIENPVLQVEHENSDFRTINGATIPFRGSRILHSMQQTTPFEAVESFTLKEAILNEGLPQGAFELNLEGAWVRDIEKGTMTKIPARTKPLADGVEKMKDDVARAEIARRPEPPAASPTPVETPAPRVEKPEAQAAGPGADRSAASARPYAILAVLAAGLAGVALWLRSRDSAAG